MAKADRPKRARKQRARARTHPARPSAATRSIEPGPAAPPVLPAEALRWRCDPDALPFESTADIEPITGVIGQDAAVDALRFGLETNAPGQHVFVRGLAGTGRMTLIRRLLEEIRLVCPEARDRCYVQNFAQPDRPRLISLPHGRGRAFAQRVDELADYIRDELKDALSAEAIVARRKVFEQETQRKIDEVVQPFEKSLREAGLSLVSFQVGPAVQSALLPRIDDKTVAPEEFEQLHATGKVTDEQYAGIREAVERFQEQLGDVTNKVNEVRNAHVESMQSLWKREARSILAGFTAEIAREFPGPQVQRFLDDVVEDVVTRRRRAIEKEADFTRMYRVNVVLGRDAANDCPIIVESTPTIANLLGTIDQSIVRGEAAHTDHMMIRTGSLLRADGGYLIVEARDLLREPGSWKVLVRTLRTRRLEIVPPEMIFPWWGPSLKPEPIDVNIKVVLLGDSEMYYLLDSYDPDFPDLFKVLADFDAFVPRDEHGIHDYGRVLARIAREEELPPFDRGAVAALVEHGARIAAYQGRLTTRFGRLADVAREAAFIATKAGNQRVLGDDVREAVRRNKQRADLPSRRFRDYMAAGVIRVQTRGREVGQVNGLAVLQAGPLTYGFPARITATIGPGSAGVINIEREADLSGAIHTKGFYILGGLLRFLLRTVHPLAFDASVAFEQSYGGIDGDSASGAEICCLLSALTDVPLRQDLAMTGAIDQVGNILAVGAVNEKIEGFFDVCRDVELTGTQGVLIPRANAADLMLRQDVVDACAIGRFQVYAVDTVHQALEILTGMRAGQRNAEGMYPEGTLLGLALDRAFEFWLKASQRADLGAAGPSQPPDAMSTAAASREASRRRASLTGRFRRRRLRPRRRR